MHRAHVLGAALVSCILEKSGVSKVVIGAAAVALLAIGLLLVTAEPWKVLWGLALSGAHLAHFPGWDPQTSIFRSTWGLSMAPWPRPACTARSGWRRRCWASPAQLAAVAWELWVFSCCRRWWLTPLAAHHHRGQEPIQSFLSPSWDNHLEPLVAQLKLPTF